jgi:hypothetical protein
MKHFIISSIATTALLMSTTLSAQQYMTREGQVRFFSTTPVEDIEAINNQTTGLLTANGEFAFRVPILGFRFEKALMEEHFNENYMETSKFPNGSFEGRITNWNDGLQDGEWHVVDADGKFTIHGVENDRSIPVQVKWNGSAWEVKSDFSVAPADHQIDIPKIVRNKIAESLEVSVQAVLNPR